jgi:hypothetical protein
MIELGSRVRDRITGFSGIVISRHEYLAGCVRWGVQPEALDKDGKMLDDKVFDEPQLELLKKGVFFKTAPTPVVGGPPRHDDNDRR